MWFIFCHCSLFPPPFFPKRLLLKKTHTCTHKPPKLGQKETLTFLNSHSCPEDTEKVSENVFFGVSSDCNKKLGYDCVCHVGWMSTWKRLPWEVRGTRRKIKYGYEIIWWGESEKVSNCWSTSVLIFWVTVTVWDKASDLELGVVEDLEHPVTWCWGLNPGLHCSSRAVSPDLVLKCQIRKSKSSETSCSLSVMLLYFGHLFFSSPAWLCLLPFHWIL